MRTRVLFIVGLVALSSCATSGESPEDRSEDGASAVTAAPSTTATTTVVTTDPPASPSTAPTTTSSTTTTTTVGLNPDEAVALADAFYEAANDGDLGRASALGRLSAARRTAITSLDAWFWWRCESEDGERVRCEETIRDSFYGQAGLYHEGTIEYEVADGGLVPLTPDCLAEEPTGAYLEFALAFDQWLEETHPGTVGWTQLPDRGDPNFELGLPCSRYLGLRPDAADSIVLRVAEFVESSPDYPIEMVIRRDGSDLSGSRLETALFDIEQGTSAWDEIELTRQPFGAFVDLGWKGTVWQVHEVVPGSERRSGRYLQVEIHRLWPEGDIDVLWLTDYSGVTRDQLTGYSAAESPTFNLLDALTLRGRLDRFALHGDCRSDGDIVAGLLSFERGEPEVIVAWTVDIDSMRFVELPEPGRVEIGDCFEPQTRR